MPKALTDEEKDRLRNLFKNLPLYCEKVLKVRTKSGEIVPFVLNKAQNYIHERLEEQKAKTGKVRAIILKARQEGATTYVTARYYRDAVTNKGLSVGTLSHLSDTTDKIYEIAKRYYDNAPPELKPITPINNSRKIRFDIDSGWDLGTAGTDEVGRGGTLQRFHGSEVAFYPHPEKMRSGIMQSVADVPGTEIILESTANGFDSFFHPMCQDAINGVGDYILIFIPWYWMQEYSRPLDAPIELTEEEAEIKTLHGLTDEQINWRRSKIIELGSLDEFKKEYPADPNEAFQTSGNSFIKPSMVMQARKYKADLMDYRDAPLIMGVDPSRVHDRTVITFRKGRKILKIFVFDPRVKIDKTVDRVVFIHQTLDQMIIAGLCSKFIDSYKPEICAIDVGEGWGIIDRLREQGYGTIVKPVKFGGGADDPITYANKRAEIWYRLRDWIHQEDGPVDIPDCDAIQIDMCSMPNSPDSSNGRLKMVSKETIKAKKNISPDIAESIALTLAFLTISSHGVNKIKKVGGLKSVKKQIGANSFSPGNIFARPQ